MGEIKLKSTSIGLSEECSTLPFSENLDIPRELLYQILDQVSEEEPALVAHKIDIYSWFKEPYFDDYYIHIFIISDKPLNSKIQDSLLQALNCLSLAYSTFIDKDVALTVFYRGEDLTIDNLKNKTYQERLNLRRRGFY